MGIKFRVAMRSPGKTQQNVTGKDIEEAIKYSVTSMIYQNLASSVAIAKNRTFTILATFIQRVAARTPLDEDYDGHEKDDKVCRESWIIANKSVRVTTKEILKSYPDIFDNFNDSSSINKIRDFLRQKFENHPLDQFVISNASDHFSILEYGGYDGERDIIKGDKYEHGVKNKHSVQAPAGMLRITQAEWESIKQSGKPIASKFRSQKVAKLPSKARLKKFVEIIRQKRAYPVMDIERLYK